MAEEVSHFYTVFWSRRRPQYRQKFEWIHHTFNGLLFCTPIRGSLELFIQKHFGRSAVGGKLRCRVILMPLVLVDGELWTDEAVFWQGRLQDGREYEVVHGTIIPTRSC